MCDDLLTFRLGLHLPSCDYDLDEIVRIVNQNSERLDKFTLSPLEKLGIFLEPPDGYDVPCDMFSPPTTPRPTKIDDQEVNVKPCANKFSVKLPEDNGTSWRVQKLQKEVTDIMLESVINDNTEKNAQSLNSKDNCDTSLAVDGSLFPFRGHQQILPKKAELQKTRSILNQVKKENVALLPFIKSKDISLSIVHNSDNRWLHSPASLLKKRLLRPSFDGDVSPEIEREVSQTSYGTEEIPTSNNLTEHLEDSTMEASSTYLPKIEPKANDVVCEVKHAIDSVGKETDDNFLVISSVVSLSEPQTWECSELDDFLDNLEEEVKSETVSKIGNEPARSMSSNDDFIKIPVKNLVPKENETNKLTQSTKAEKTGPKLLPHGPRLSECLPPVQKNTKKLDLTASANSRFISNPRKRKYKCKNALIESEPGYHYTWSGGKKLRITGSSSDERTCKFGTNVGLVVYPGPNAPLSSVAVNHLEKLRQRDTHISAAWANFSASAVITKSVRRRFIIPVSCPVARKSAIVRNTSLQIVEQSSLHNADLKSCSVVLHRIKLPAVLPWCMEHHGYGCAQCGLGNFEIPLSRPDRPLPRVPKKLNKIDPVLPSPTTCSLIVNTNSEKLKRLTRYLKGVQLGDVNFAKCDKQFSWFILPHDSRISRIIYTNPRGSWIIEYFDAIRHHSFKKCPTHMCVSQSFGFYSFSEPPFLFFGPYFSEEAHGLTAYKNQLQIPLYNSLDELKKRNLKSDFLSLRENYNSIINEIKRLGKSWGITSIWLTAKSASDVHLNAEATPISSAIQYRYIPASKKYINSSIKGIGCVAINKFGDASFIEDPINDFKKIYVTHGMQPFARYLAKRILFIPQKTQITWYLSHRRRKIDLFDFNALHEPTVVLKEKMYRLKKMDDDGWWSFFQELDEVFEWGWKARDIRLMYYNDKASVDDIYRALKMLVRKSGNGMSTSPRTTRNRAGKKRPLSSNGLTADTPTFTSKRRQLTSNPTKMPIPLTVSEKQRSLLLPSQLKTKEDIIAYNRSIRGLTTCSSPPQTLMPRIPSSSHLRTLTPRVPNRHLIRSPKQIEPTFMKLSGPSLSPSDVYSERFVEVSESMPQPIVSPGSLSLISSEHDYSLLSSGNETPEKHLHPLETQKDKRSSNSAYRIVQLGNVLRDNIVPEGRDKMTDDKKLGDLNLQDCEFEYEIEHDHNEEPESCLLQSIESNKNQETSAAKGNFVPLDEVKDRKVIVQRFGGKRKSADNSTSRILDFNTNSSPMENLQKCKKLTNLEDLNTRICKVFKRERHLIGQK